MALRIQNDRIINQEFGLILEDMHDENVIAKDNLLFLIDTVFYITEPGTQRT